MTSQSTTLQQGDNRAVDYQLNAGNPPDLTGCTCVLEAWQYGASTPITQNTVILGDPTAGQVRVTYTPALTATPGEWRAVVKVTNSGYQASYPEDGWLTVNVTQNPLT